MATSYISRPRLVSCQRGTSARHNASLSLVAGQRRSVRAAPRLAGDQGAGAAAADRRSVAPAARVRTHAHATAVAPDTEAASRYLHSYALPAARELIDAYAEPEALLASIMTLPDLDAALDPASPAADATARDRAARLAAAVAAAMDAAYGPEGNANSAGAAVVTTQPEPSVLHGDLGVSAAAAVAAAASGALPSSSAAFTIASELRGLDAAGHDGAAAPGGAGGDGNVMSREAAAAHTFLQRLLYRINRLAHFWYDPLALYTNERSLFLQSLRNAVEARWQRWEAGQLPAELLGALRAAGPEEVKAALRDRFHRDVDPPLYPSLSYVAREMPPLGYAHLLAVGSLDGLVEASRQSRVCAGAANPVSCAVFRVLSEEYGGGRLPRKHSTFYSAMMTEMGLDTREEAYLDLVPWQALANANNNFLLTERRRHYLRYLGGLTFFEINGPSVYRAYLSAARRCQLSERACGYWELHIREDERHGRQMLDEVALPLVDMYPRDSWEVLLGYEQEAFMGARAGAAVVGAIRAAGRRAALAAGAKA